MRLLACVTSGRYYVGVESFDGRHTSISGSLCETLLRIHQDSALEGWFSNNPNHVAIVRKRIDIIKCTAQAKQKLKRSSSMRRRERAGRSSKNVSPKQKKRKKEHGQPQSKRHGAKVIVFQMFVSSCGWCCFCCCFL